MGRSRFCALVFSAAIMVSAASSSALAQDRLSVVSVNYPLHYFVTRIGGDFVEASFPVPADVDPAFWKPSGDEVALLQAADMIVLNGAGYAKWVSLAALPRRKLVVTSDSFDDRLIETEGATHQHGPTGEHSHGALAFTTWLDPVQAISQADAIRAALMRRLPERQTEIDANFGRLEADLIALDRALGQAFAPLVDTLLLASHPVYQYLGRRYGLDIVSFLWEPEVVPDNEQWRALAATAKSRGARVMIWEGEPAVGSRRRLEALGIDIIVFAPAMNVSDEGDFFSVMLANAESVRAAAARSAS